MAEDMSFDLGIESTTVLGNAKDANAFLSEEAETVIGDEKVIEKIEEKKVEEKKEEEEKKEPEDKTKTIDSFLGIDEEEEEDEDILKKKEEIVKKETPTDSNPYKEFSKELYTLNVLTPDSDEEPAYAETPEELLALMNAEKQKGAGLWLENYLARFGEDRRELFDAIFVSGVDPEKYLPTYNEVQKFEGMDLEVEENQEATVRAYYTRLGWHKADVDKKVEKLKTYSDLEDEAKTAHPKILEQDKQKLTEMTEAEEQKQARIAAADTEYRAQISNVLNEKLKAKEFDGIPVDDKTAKQAFDFMYTKKWKLPSGELLTDFDKFILETKNPDNISKRVKLSLLALNDFDFSKIQKKAVTKDAPKLFTSLATKEKQKEKQTTASSGW